MSYLFITHGAGITWQTCHIHCEFSSFIVFILRRFHKSLVTEKSITCLPLSLIFPIWFILYCYWSFNNTIIIRVSLITKIVVVLSLLISIKQFPHNCRKGKSVEILLGYWLTCGIMCGTKITKITVDRFYKCRFNV